MYNFLNHSANDPHHHDHDHGTARSEVGPNDGNNSNSESRHDYEELNQHKQEKESKDMNRTIKNSITPIFAGFAVSMMFLFTLTVDAMSFDRVKFQNDNPQDITATYDFSDDTRNYDPNARYNTDDQITFLNNDDNVDYDDPNFDGDVETDPRDFADADVVDPVDGNANRLDVNQNNDDNRFDGIDEVNVIPVVDGNLADFDNPDANGFDISDTDVLGDGDMDVRDSDQDTRIDPTDAADFNGDSSNIGDLAS